MTDKQFSSLLTTIVGAALFVSGAVILTYDDFSKLLMIFGGVLMGKEVLISFIIRFMGDTEKEDDKNDAH